MTDDPWGRDGLPPTRSTDTVDAFIARKQNCGDCGVTPGEPHIPGCDVARCLWTGTQRIQCEEGYFAHIAQALRRHGETVMADELLEYAGADADHDCGDEIWTGVWPGRDDVLRLGLSSLNDLGVLTEWDRDKQRWELG